MKKNKKMWGLIAVFLVGIGLLYTFQSCSHKEIYIKSKLLKNCQNDRLTIGNLDIGHVWDSILIIKPYDDVDNYHIQLEESDKQAINTYADFDSTCTLVFLFKGKLVAYTTIPRTEVVDFVTTKKTQYARTETFEIIDKKAYDLNS